MPPYRTMFYMDWNGISFSLSWSTEQHLLAARTLLQSLGASYSEDAEYDFFLLQNAEQYRAVQDLRRELEGDRTEGGA